MIPLRLPLVLPLVLIACGGADEPRTQGAPAADEDRLSSLPDRSYDWLIAGGEVVDGSGSAPRAADVLLRDGRVAHVGSVDPDTLEIADRFDARGLLVTPGFIDVHAHGDPIDAGRFPNFIAMGVTTIVLGQDGSGPPASELASHLDAVDAARPAVNVAYLLGHNTLRGEAEVGFSEPSSESSRRIADLVSRGLDAGAFGLSTGLEYDPGRRADLDELASIARPVGERGAVVMSHMRNEDADAVEASLEELLEQGRRSGARVHASHLKVVLGSDTLQAHRLLDAMERARRDGTEATADIYPYTASFTGLSILFPDWARPPNDYESAVRERRAELAEHLRARVEARNGPDATLFGSGEWRGRTLAEVARESGRPYEEILVDLGPGGARAAYFVMDEGVMATLLRDPHVAVASDGSPTMSHPRGYGTFARVLRRYVVEETLLTPQEAIRKMTGLPASIVGLDDPDRVDVPRGILQPEWAADVAVFDPAEIRDPASYEEPHQTARGMRAVWVGGDVVWRDGAAVEGMGRGTALRARYPEVAGR